MKKLKYILLLFIIFLSPHVYALEYNVTNSITSPVAPSNEGTYTGEERNGATSSFNVNTRYNGLLQRIRFNIPKPSSIDGDCYMSNMTYKVTMNMATNDWRNRFGTVRVVPYSSSTTNFSNGKVTFVSYKKIYFTFKIPSSDTNCYDFVYIDLPSSATFTPFTGDTNWNLQSIILSDEITSGGSTTPSGPSSSFNDTAIIDNNNKNTQDVINNNNENTTNIINNNNQNTQEIVNQLSKDCSNLVDISNFTLTRNSTDYYKNIDFGSNMFSSNEYTISLTNYNNLDLIFQIYTTGFGKQVAQCSGKTGCSFSTSESWGAISIFLPSSVSTGSSSTISKVMLVTGNSSKTYCQYGSKVSNFDETTNAINDTNNYLKDDSNPVINDSDITDVFNIVHFTDPLSYLLTLPTQLINKIVSLSDTCSAIDLGSLYGVHLTLPCINLENILGSDLWNTLDIILSVGLLSVILKNFYDTISNLLTLGGEKEAKEKFSMPTPMDFLALILGGDSR